MVSVGVAPDIEVAFAECLQGVAVPRLDLSANLGQPECVRPVGERGERAARLDLRQLMVVADEDELGVGCGGVVGEPCELPGADHRRLVDDQDVAGAQPVAAVIVVQRSGDRRARDPGGVLQLASGARRQGAPGHATARRLPDLARSVEGVGLAGTGGRADDVDAAR